MLKSGPTCTKLTAQPTSGNCFSGNYEILKIVSQNATLSSFHCSLDKRYELRLVESRDSSPTVSCPHQFVAATTKTNGMYTISGRCEGNVLFMNPCSVQTVSPAMTVNELPQIPRCSLSSTAQKVYTHIQYSFESWVDRDGRPFQGVTDQGSTCTVHGSMQPLGFDISTFKDKLKEKGSHPFSEHTVTENREAKPNERGCERIVCPGSHSTVGLCLFGNGCVVVVVVF